MKKLALTSLLVAITPALSHADLLFTVGARSNVWEAEPTGQLDEGISADDEQDGLGLEEDSGNVYEIYVEHPVPMIPNARLSLTSIVFDGDGFITPRLGGDINNDFAIDNFGRVKSTFDLSHSDVTLYWGLPIPMPLIDVNFGLTGRTFDGFVRAESKDVPNQVEEVELDFTLPMLFGQVTLDTPVGLYGYVDLNYVGYDGNALSDIRYAVGFDIPVPVVDLGIEAGYRSIAMETDKDSTDIETDVDVDGTYIGLSFSVGL